MDENVSFVKTSDSILLSVKKLIGISEDEDSFDLDITLHINAALSTLYQLGVLQHPFTVTSRDDVYEDLIPDVTDDVINQIKMYLVYKTKLGFDSSTLSSALIDTLKEMIKEAEWRLMISFNPTDTFE